MKLVSVYGLNKINDFTYEVNEGSDPPINLNDIVKVSIRTTDEGPFLEDVFLMIYDKDDTVFEVEQQAPFYYFIYGIVSLFKDFNYDQVIKAMQSTQNNEFICWEKK